MPWKPIDVMDQKEKFVLEALREDVAFTQLCRRYEISAVTGYYWKERFLAEGRSGLCERPRRPNNSPDKLREDVICEIVRIKRAHPSFGPEKIRIVYGRLHGEAPSLSSFKRVLFKAGLVQPRKTRRRIDPNSLPKVTLNPEAPNDIWTVDFKGWWHTDTGRCEPLTVRDAFSRYVIGVQAMSTTRTEAVRAQFEYLFSEYGMPKTIHSDNGSPFACSRAPRGLSKLSAWWTVLGIQLSRSRPGHPQDNGGHERMHRDLEDSVQPAIANAGTAAQVILEQWQHEFNCVRPHRALNMRCPCDVYSKSARSFTGTPELIDYGQTFVSRMVSSVGTIAWLNYKYYISSALSGWNVGIKPIDEIHSEVWFDHLLLGLIDSACARFIWARPDEAPVP